MFVLLVGLVFSGYKIVEALFLLKMKKVFKLIDNLAEEV